MKKLLELIGKNEATFIGGHYKWPGIPTKYAVQSAILARNLANQINGEMYIFLDDIGASDACSGNVCSAPSQLMANVDNNSEINNREWLDSILKDLADNSDNYNAVPQILNNVPSGIIVNKQSVDTMLLDLERYIYQSDRTKFSTILLNTKTTIPHKKILFERSMSNGSSRQLHKIIKKNIATGMVVNSNDGETSFYSTSSHSFMEGKTLLRREIHSESGTKASNFCSALLAQLFFKVLRSRKHKNSNHSIMYIIPCYDRGRLYEAIHAFYSIYSPSFQHWFELQQVTIIISYFFNSKMIHDFYLMDEHEISYYTKGTDYEYLS
ncbi:MAG: hypothetical protein Q9M31_08945 [Mariprofundus sp.]|nr:hypothetical protein [Mariprofundus sp.]